MAPMIMTLASSASSLRSNVILVSFQSGKNCAVRHVRFEAEQPRNFKPGGTVLNLLAHARRPVYS